MGPFICTQRKETVFNYWSNIFAHCGLLLGPCFCSVTGSMNWHPMTRGSQAVPLICTPWTETVLCYCLIGSLYLLPVTRQWWVPKFAPCDQRQYLVIGSIYLHPVINEITQQFDPYICTLLQKNLLCFDKRQVRIIGSTHWHCYQSHQYSSSLVDIQALIVGTHVRLIHFVP